MGTFSWKPSSYADKATISSTDKYQATINLYATWILESSIKGTLILDGNGGNVNGVPILTTNYSEGDEVSIPTLDREGYLFTGWTKDGSSYALPEEWNFDGTLELKASWRKIKYKLVYHANNGTGETNVSSEYEYDQDITLANNSYTKDNYHFVGWTIDGDASKKVYDASSQVSKLTDVDGSEIHLLANWEGDKFKITLNGSNPTTGVVSSESYIYGENKTIPANSFTKSGHKFSGWALTEGSSKVDYYNNAVADVIYAATHNANINLYAVWVRNSETVEIVFDANGGTIDGQTRIKATMQVEARSHSHKQ